MKASKIKTREGKSTKLAELLDEARDRAVKMFEERLKSEDGSVKVQVEQEKLHETAERMGISAIKYYDLKQNRTQNYVFSFDKMLDPRGNTGVYLLYAYVRILSIMAKANNGAGESLEKLKLDDQNGFRISAAEEKALAMTILRLPEQLELATDKLQLNCLCDQLYEIATKISEFYSSCKVLGEAEEDSRILLLESTKKVMEVCFDLLGMKTIEKI